MRITEDIRRLADEQGVAAEQVLQAGMAAKAEEFRAGGSEIYK
jgi:phosphomethylpyrimidine synthase